MKPRINQTITTVVYNKRFDATPRQVTGVVTGFDSTGSRFYLRETTPKAGVIHNMTSGSSEWVALDAPRPVQSRGKTWMVAAWYFTAPLVLDTTAPEQSDLVKAIAADIGPDYGIDKAANPLRYVGETVTVERVTASKRGYLKYWRVKVRVQADDTPLTIDAYFEHSKMFNLAGWGYLPNSQYPAATSYRGMGVLAVLDWDEHFEGYRLGSVQKRGSTEWVSIAAVREQRQAEHEAKHAKKETPFPPPLAEPTGEWQSPFVKWSDRQAKERKSS
jgi:hypothetical protein